MMEYKGYIGKVDFDDEAGIFHGEVVNLRDVITFAGESVTELRQAFQESVDDYLAFCAERNEPPEKPFSGTFTVRVTPELHRAISVQARLANKSLNSYVGNLLKRSVIEQQIDAAYGDEPDDEDKHRLESMRKSTRKQLEGTW